MLAASKTIAGSGGSPILMGLNYLCAAYKAFFETY
jgi:hypothetical protein